LSILTSSESLAKIKMLSLFTVGEVATLVDRAESLNAWCIAHTTSPTSNENVVDKSRWDASVVVDASHPELFVDIKVRIYKAFRKYLDAANDIPLVVDEVAIMRYEAGGHLWTHADASPTHGQRRRVSVVCYLNDDYQGGVTFFTQLNHGFRGHAGDALIFPSTYIHRSNVVEAGRKYVLIFFLSVYGKIAAGQLEAVQIGTGILR